MLYTFEIKDSNGYPMVKSFAKLKPKSESFSLLISTSGKSSLAHQRISPASSFSVFMMLAAIR